MKTAESIRPTFFVEAYMTPGKVWLVEVEKLCLEKYKVVGDYINTMKTTFDFNFDSYQAIKQHEYTIHITVN